MAIWTVAIPTCDLLLSWARSGQHVNGNSASHNAMSAEPTDFGRTGRPSNIYRDVLTLLDGR